MNRVSREVLSPLLDVSAISCRAQVGQGFGRKTPKALVSPRFHVFAEAEGS